MSYEFADRLIELRKAHGMSQEELAGKIGLTRQAVSKWERAESSPDIANLVALAEVYGLSIDDIVKGPGPAVSEADAAAESAGSQPEADAAQARDAASGQEPPAADAAAAAQAPQAPDVSEMPPPDPTQRVDWADAMASWHHREGGTQAPPPGHPFGGHRGAPEQAAQPAAPIEPAAERAPRARKPPALLFPYPVLCAFLYLLFGFLFGWWHPGWIIFFTIPFYYWVVNVVVHDPNYRARHDGVEG